jgi:hypothetical protein
MTEINDEGFGFQNTESVICRSAPLNTRMPQTVFKAARY